ncbi:MAG: sulfatase activating formylglycine-generating enzyme, partial [Candidatus Paceibacteria bacterium]
HPRVATGLVVFVLLLSSVTVRAFFMAGAKVQEGREVLNRVVDDASELELRRSELASLLEAKRQGAEFDLGRIGGLRDQFQARRQQLESDMDLTESTLRRSFDHIGGYSRARRAIAELYAQRIHLAMAESSDVVMGSEFARLERGLVEFDDDGTHAAMLLTTGWARLNCVQPGATVHVWADGEPEGVRQENPLPFLFEGQEEGSYFARFQAPGFADVLLHFLIRRDAVYDAGESMPPREREVELFRKQEVPNGWVVIPGGYGLYGEDPTRWKWVGTTIMKELEVTLGEWIEWLNKLLEPSSESWHVLARAMTVGGQGAHLPRYGDGSGNLMIELDEASGRWVPRGSSPHVLQEPVCGLTIYDMKDYVRCAVLAGESVPEGWYVDMPSVHEWRRAARGADGRRFVWGDKFDAAKLAGANTMGLLDPVQTRFHQLAVGAVAADTSPFGVRDMSGSKIEATNHTFGRVRGEWAFCGGSSKSYRPEDVSVMQVTGKPSRPYWDAGLRLVMRRLDPVFVEDFMQGTTFSDDFERSSGDSVGNGWWEGTHYPHGIDGDPNAFELCRIQNGELLVTGRAGNSSQPSLAIHRLPGPSSAFELELVMGVQWQSDCARTPGFGLMEEPGATGSTSCKIGFNSDGCARLQFAEDGVVLADMISKPIAIEGDLHLGLHYADRVLRIEVRNQAGGPTEEIVFTLDKEPRPMGFLVIEGTNLCATTTRVKQLEYRRLR